MKSSRGSLSPIMERCTPQHPLPEEIRNLSNDETICQFCGISYLIHHEIKRLENVIAALEEELSHCRQSRENELRLREEVDKLNATMKSLDSNIVQKESLITELTAEIQNGQQGVVDLQKESAHSKQVISKLRDRYSERMRLTKERAESLKKDIQLMKIEMLDLEKETNTNRLGFKNYMEDIEQKFQLLLTNNSAEIKSLQGKCEKLEEELNEKLKIEEVMKTRVKDTESKLMKYEANRETFNKDVELKTNHLEEENRKIRIATSDLQKEISTLQDQLKVEKCSTAQLNQVIGQNQQQMQQLMDKLDQSEKYANTTINRMNQEIKQMERELVEVSKERRKWKNAEEKLEMQQKELMSKMNLASGESEQLDSSLKEARNQLELLKSEREKMIISHQNQIEQLRNSFREKLNSAEGNSSGMEERIQQLQSLYDAKMKQQENKLQKNFAIEHELLKDKHEEILQQWISRYKDITQETETDLKREMQARESDIKVLQQQLKSAKSDHELQNSQHEKETEGLKRIISQLEERLSDLMAEQSDIEVDLKNDLNAVRQSHQSTEKENNCLKEEVRNLTQEIEVLQETVRRECEERFELTEALGDLRGQLQHSKFPTQIISKKQRNSSANSGLSARILESLEGNELENLPSRNVPFKHSIPLRNGFLGAQNPVDDISPAVRDIAFSTPSPVNSKYKLSSKGSDESVESVRRRIAAAIKKK